jgi:hypothetical protein
MAFLKAIPLRKQGAPVAPGRAGFLLALVLLVTGTLALTAWSAESASEPRVKAALIFRFASLAEWPATAFPASNAPLRVVVLGPGPLEASLREVVADKKIGARPVEIVPPKELGRPAAVHLLVVTENHRGPLPDELRKTSGKPVLTIGEPPEFTGAGGMIRLRRDGSRLTFDVNVRALRLAEPAGLKINPQVLKLGHIVEGGDTP